MWFAPVVSLPPDRVDAVLGDPNFLGVENMESLIGKMVRVNTISKFAKNKVKGQDQFCILVTRISERGIAGQMLYKYSSSAQWKMLDLPDDGGFLSWNDMTFFRVIKT